MTLNVEGGDDLMENYVGKNFANYDHYVILSHFNQDAIVSFPLLLYAAMCVVN